MLFFIKAASLIIELLLVLCVYIVPMVLQCHVYNMSCTKHLIICNVLLPQMCVGGMYSMYEPIISVVYYVLEMDPV